MVAGYIPPGEDKKKLVYESHLHIWDLPYLFRVYANGLLGRCVPAKEGIQIVKRCNSSPYGGHYGVFHTHAKIWQSGFYWPPCMKTQKILFRDVEHVRSMGI
jgi:hypothetical protein